MLRDLCIINIDPNTYFKKKKKVENERASNIFFQQIINPWRRNQKFWESFKKIKKKKKKS